MIPSSGYTIRYRNRGFNEPRRTEDSFYELDHQFLVCELHRDSPTIVLDFRLSTETYEDEFPKITEQTGAAMMDELLLRWAVRRIDDGLRDGSIESSTKWIELRIADLELLREMIDEKDCDYQVKEGRDLFCSASVNGDAHHVATIGLRAFARTSMHWCRECTMPDRGFLCSHLSHAQVTSVQPTGRSVRFAQCERDEPNIAAPALCHARGHGCWEWIVPSREEDKPPTYAPPALTKALDLLDTVWRLRFGRDGALVKLPSATSIANLERDCSTEEEFQGRVIAFADVLSAFEIRETLVNGQKIEGSLNRLEFVLRRNINDEADREAALAGLAKLRAANKLRRAAAHGAAKADRVSAERTLGITFYPQTTWQDVWNQLRARIAQALENITIGLRKGM
jgi:hypothetical protein